MRTNAYVYVMTDESGLIKIGMSQDPNVRARQLKRSVVLRHKTDMLEKVEKVERMAHKLMVLRGLRVGSGEWFKGSVAEAITAVEIAQHLVDGGTWCALADIVHEAQE